MINRILSTSASKKLIDELRDGTGQADRLRISTKVIDP